MPAKPYYLRIQDAADFLKVSAKTLRRWEKTKKLIPLRTYGNQRRYTREQLEAIIISKSSPVPPQAQMSNFLQPNLSTYVRPISLSIPLLLLALVMSGSVIGLTPGLTPLRSELRGVSSDKDSRVLAASASNVAKDQYLSVAIPATFLKDITAPNVIYAIKAGAGINISSGQTPTITSTQVGWKTIAVTGQTSLVTATSSGTLTFTAGSGMALTTTPDDNKITISASGSDLNVSGWQTSGTNVILKTLTNKVGIGTASPVNTLDVTGTFGVTGNTYLTGLTTGSMPFIGASGLISQDATNLFWDSANTVLNTSNVIVTGLDASSGVYTDANKQLTTTPPVTGSWGYWTRTGTTMIPLTTTDNIVTLGSVGVGTTNPGAKLDVNGAIKLSGSDNIIMNGNWLSGDGGDEGVFVSTTGNVGIGTTNSTSLLTVAGDIAATNIVSNTTTFNLATSATTLNIGAPTGNTTVNNTLNVTGTTFLNGIVNIGDAGEAINLSGTTISLTANGAGNDITANLADNNTDALDIQESTNNYINIDTTNTAENVSFGNPTTNPTFSFLGSGTATFNGNVNLAADKSLYLFPGVGKVGIGTTAPDAKLEVTGTVIGKALVIFNDTGTGQNILVASASGTPVLTVNRLGQIGTATWNGVTIGPTYGGTGQNTWATGDILYASGTDTLAKRAAGSVGQALVMAGGVPTWGTISGDICTDCLLDDPAVTQTITPIAADATGLSVAQANSGSVDIFNVTNFGGGTKYFYVDSAGLVTLNNIKLPTGAHSGWVLTSDANGVGSWTDTTGTGSFGAWSLTGTTIYPNLTTYDLLLGSDSTAAVVGKFTVSGTKVGKALAVFNDTGTDQNILVASVSGVAKFIVDHSGGITTSGDITINGGNILTTTAPTFNLLNTNATTLNIGGAATTIGIGNTSGVTTINNQLAVNNATLSTDQTTFNLLNTVATTVNFGGAATTLNMGAPTGNTTVNNTLNVTGTTFLNGIVNIGDAGEAINLSGTTISLTANGAGNDITAHLVDNNTDALNIQESTNNYINIATTNTTENITFGNATTNPKFIFAGSGTVQIDNLTASSAVYTDANKLLTSAIPPSGVLGYWTRTGTNLYNTNQGDNVGIGTTNPTVALEVNGGIKATTFNGNTITAGSGILTLGAGKTLTVNDSTVLNTNTVTFGGTEILTLTAGKSVSFAEAFSTTGSYPLTLTSTASTLATLPPGTVTLAGLSTTQTFTATQTFSNPTYSALFTGGNVGIGTTNPISTLSVGATSQFQVNSTGNIVLLNNVITSFPSSQGVAGSLMTNNGSGVLSWAPPSGTGTLGYWQRNGTSLAPSNIGDNVGIGTTSPANTTAGDLTATRLFLGTSTALTTNAIAPLQVVGNSAATSQILSARIADDTLPPGFQSAKARGSIGSLSAIQSGDQIYSIAGYGYVSSSVFAQGMTIIATTDDTPSSTAIPTRLSFSVANQGIPEEALRIDSKRNVGVGDIALTGLFQVAQQTIGTGKVSTPGSSTTLTGVGTQFTNTFKVGDILTVTGETVRTIASITSNTILDVSVAFSATPRSAVAYTLTGGTRFSVLGNGNVGIGTTNPLYPLHVAGTNGYLALQANSNISGDNTGIRFKTSVGAIDTYFKGGIFFQSTSDASGRGNIIFAQNNVASSVNATTADAVMLIQPSGNVGIGTTSPGAKLSVVGGVGIGTTDSFAGAAIAANNLAVQGSIGIGTTSPTQKLELYGGNQLIWDDTTLGSELVLNPSFDSDTTNWTAQGVGTVLSSEAGGQVNNGLKVLNGSTAYGYASQMITTIPGTKYKLTLYFKKGTSSAGILYVGTSIGGNQLYSNTGLSSASWTLYSIYFTATSTTTYIRLGNSQNTDTYYSYFDEISIKEVQGGNLALSGIITGYAGTSGIKVTGAGNVGIGTTSPGRNLTVSAASASTIGINVTGLSLTANQQTAFSALANEAGKIRNTNDTYGGLLLYGQNTNLANATAGVYINGYVENDPTVFGAIYLNGAKHNGAGVLTTIGDSNILLNIANNLTSKLVILGNGNVGIGTTSPQGALDIGTATGTGTTYLIQALAPASTNPGAKGWALGVSATRRLEILWNYSATGNDHYASISTNLSTNNLALQINGGNVGIGTTNPTSKLQVFGVGQYTADLTDAGVRGDMISVSGNNTAAGTGGAILFGNAQSDAANSLGYAAIKGLLTSGAGNTTGDLAFSTRTSTANVALSEKMRIMSNGLVGIGTTSPGALLEISKSNGAQMYITDTGNGDKPSLYLNRNQSGGSYNVGWEWYIPTSKTDLYLNRSVAASGNVIINSGSVGIGTTGPNTFLEIKGDSDTQYGNLSLIASSTGDGTYYSQSLGILTLAQDSTGSSAISQDAYYNGVNNLWKASLTNAAYGPSQILFDYTNDIIFRQAAVASRTSGDTITFTEAMRIDSSGNVGIGTISPGTKLSIVGGVGIGTTDSFASKAIAANNLAIQGSVGIGTTSPLLPLDVTGVASGADYQAMVLSNNVGSSVIGSSVSLVMTARGLLTRGAIIQAIVMDSANNSHDLAFLTTTSASVPSEKMRITAGGNVGIGTTSPGDLLDINTAGAVKGLRISDGTAKVAELLDASTTNHNGILSLYDNSNAEAVRIYAASGLNSWINSGGNLGIGTTAPSQKLEVAGGNMRIWDSSVLGGELETNPGLDTTYTGWANGHGGTLTWGAGYGYSGGGVSWTDGNAQASFQTPVITHVAGTKYKMVIRMKSVGATPVDLSSVPTSWYMNFWNASATEKATDYSSISIISLGSGWYEWSRTFTASASGSDGRIYVYTPAWNAAYEVYVDDASIKEITGGNVIASGLFTSNGTNGIKIDSAGNVGIGTTLPAVKLAVSTSDAHVYDGSVPIPYGQVLDLINTSATDNTFVGMTFSPTIATTQGMSAYIGGVANPSGSRAADIVFGRRNSATTYAESMRILYNGNVGIGTTAPDRQLEVYSSSPLLRLRDSGATANATTAFMEFGGTDAGAWVSTGYIGDAAGANADMYLKADTGKLRLGDTSGTDVLVLNSGSVGIGTTAPNKLLEVSTSGDNIFKVIAKGTGWGGTSLAEIYSERTTTGTNPLLKVSSAFAPSAFYVETSGNVGIGTTSPGSKLTVTDTAYPIADFIRTSVVTGSLYGITRFVHQTTNDMVDGFGASIGFAATDSGASNKLFGYIGGVRDSADTEGALVLGAGTNGAEEFMRIDHSGNVGIGTTAPGTKLSVVGGVGIGTTDSFASKAIAANNLAVQGSVGIGTTSPQRSLETTGSIRMGALITGAGTAVAVYRDVNGDLANSTSSIRYKTDITTLEDVLPKLMDLSAVRFNWGANTSTPGVADFGMIAEQVNTILPDLVTYEADGVTPQGLKYEKMGLFAIKGLQEQQGQIASISGQLASVTADKSDVTEYYPTLKRSDSVAEPTGSDLTQSQPDPGSVVTIGPSLGTYTTADGVSHQAFSVVKSSTAYDQKVIGVVSSNLSQSQVMGKDVLEWAESAVPVALTGRVPVKIASDSAEIQAGDLLTSSTSPGFAQKATADGYTIGKALEDWTPASGKETILISLNNSVNINATLSAIASAKADPSADLATRLSILEGEITLLKGSELTRSDLVSKFTVDTLTVNKDALLPDTLVNGNLDATGNLSSLTGNLVLTAGRVLGNSSFRGTETLPTGQDTIYIQRTWDTAPASITVTAGYDTGVWVEDVTKDGFTIRVKSAPTKDSPIYWLGIW